MHSAQVVTLKSGQQNASSVDTRVCSGKAKKSDKTFLAESTSLTATNSQKHRKAVGRERRAKLFAGSTKLREIT